MMISKSISLRPRYGEVDQMGYVYHANFVSYCHQARTELLRKFELHDSVLEENNVLLVVISMNLKYNKPAYYDDLLTIRASIPEMPLTRFNFNFEITNEKNEKICIANSTIAFVDSQTRRPMKVPDFIEIILKQQLKQICH